MATRKTAKKAEKARKEKSETAKAKAASKSKEPKSAGKVDKVVGIVTTSKGIVRLRIGGARLVCNRLSGKYRVAELRARGRGEDTSQKGRVRCPVQEFESGRYVDEHGQDCIPTAGIRKCIAAGVKWQPKANITKADLLRAIRVNPGQDLVPITYESAGRVMVLADGNGDVPLSDPEVREILAQGKKEEGEAFKLDHKGPTKRDDVVRLQGTTKAPDIRYRPEYRNWTCEIEVEFPAHILTLKQVVALVAAAGDYVGLCEWRNEKGGNWGAFTLLGEAKSKKEAA